MGTPHSPVRTPHKHAELIKAWADNTSLTIQCRAPKAGRLDTSWETIKDPEFPNWLESLEYRIKPKTIKYRNFLWGSETNPIISVTSWEENQKEPRCAWQKFLTWIGDWQEVEV